MQGEAPGVGTCLEFEPLLDSEGAARLLRIHPKTVERWARQGLIPGKRIAGRWRFRASELDEWWRSGSN